MLGRKKKSPSTEAALTEMALKIDWLIGAHIGLTCLWEWTELFAVESWKNFSGKSIPEKKMGKF